MTEREIRDLLYEANAAMQDIEALAELLRRTGGSGDLECVGRVGFMIARRMQPIEALLAYAAHNNGMGNCPSEEK